MALKIRAGDYYVKDLRERPETAMWTELDCSGGKMQEFYERLKGLKEVQSISLQRALDFRESWWMRPILFRKTLARCK